VMRRHLLNVLPGVGVKVMEQPIEIKDLLNADEVFTTNALGIKWVMEVKGAFKLFSNYTSSKIIDFRLF
jgi:branched-subunit amino acid aminotransferase/4-amino-4-deoxychorismate lyase